MSGNKQKKRVNDKNLQKNNESTRIESSHAFRGRTKISKLKKKEFIRFVRGGFSFF
jgi:hypothetical protein